MDYQSCITCGWASGIHDCRGLTYQHPWLVINRDTRTAIGCYTKKEAVQIWKKLKNLTTEDMEYADSIAQ